MGAYVEYARRPGIRRYLVVVLALCLGLMAKPMLVTLPFVLLLLDYWPLERFRIGRESIEKDSQQSLSTEIVYPKSSIWRLILEKIPLLILVAALSAAIFVIQKKIGAMHMMKWLPLNIRAVNVLASYLSYIAKTLYSHPMHLSLRFASANCQS